LTAARRCPSRPSILSRVHRTDSRESWLRRYLGGPVAVQVTSPMRLART
jgi:hypothetical protein